MDAAQSFQKLFETWPAEVPRAGLLVTTFNETIPFVDFLVSEGTLIVQRNQPDSQNARKAIVAYGAISAVKLADPGDLAVYTRFGFRVGGAAAAAPAAPTRSSLPPMPPRRPISTPTA